MTVSRWVGLKNVIRNLDRKDKQIGKAVEVGLKQAGLFLQAEAQKRVPVLTGNLKRSADTRAEGKRFKTKVSVVFTASYAVYVHEAPMKLKGLPRPNGRGSYWDPQGRATNKFLEIPARTKRKQMVRIVEKRVRRVTARP